MAIINRDQYHRIESEILEIVQPLQGVLPADDIEHIDSMLSVAEIEMAFESLGLSLMQKGMVFSEPEVQMLL